MNRAASIAGLSLAAAVWAAPTTASAAGDDNFRWGSSLAPERASISPIQPVPDDTAKRPVRPAEPHVGRKPIKSSKAAVAEVKPAVIPSGPLQIVVSIAKQRVTLYADGKPVASSPASTGMPGHPTPVGVFSVIQKHKDHYSNIYGAAMPYMQRITWSGAALHEGPLPGHPASHGCIRLSSGFAQMLWKVTKIGARVIVTRDDVAPVEIEMANPFAPKPKMVDAPALKTLVKTADAASSMASASRTPVPAPITTTGAASAQPATSVRATEQATKSDGTTTIKVAEVKAPADPSTGPVVKRDTTGAIVTQTAANTSAPEQATKVMIEPAAIAATLDTAKVDDAKVEAKVEAQPDAAPAANEQTAQNAPASAQATKSNGESSLTITETKPAGDIANAAGQIPQIEPAPVSFEGASPVTASVAAKSVVAKPVVAQRVFEERPSAPVEDVPLPQPAPGHRDAKKSNSPISIFISRKEAKLYVRQKMEPLFDVPVTIQRADQPMGTHVFTATAAKGDDGDMRWTVISIPSNLKHIADKHADRKKVVEILKPRHDKQARLVIEEANEPIPDARAALGRVVIPPDVVERISTLFIPGSSIIVSDNRLSDETGEYTEFIVLTP